MVGTSPRKRVGPERGYSSILSPAAGTCSMKYIKWLVAAYVIKELAERLLMWHVACVWLDNEYALGAFLEEDLANAGVGSPSCLENSSDPQLG